MADRFLSTTTRWEMVWVSAPRPPVHPTPMTGRESFKSMEEALTRFSKFADDAEFKSLTLVIEERKDFTEDAADRIKRLRAAKEAASCE